MGIADGTEHGWPAWARTQLEAAIDVARCVSMERPLAAELYERWFCGAGTPVVATRPLVGEYRRAHAGTASTIVDGMPVLDRHDRVGQDGWWRTWNTSWRPRRTGTRALFSPHPDAVADVVGRLTAALRDVPYVLSCSTSAARLTRRGSVVLYVPRRNALPPALIESVGDLLRPDTPPLCLPVAPGIAVAQHPDNGMSFGEHRCHLVALAIATALGSAGAPATLRTIGDVFLAHGVDPSAPHRTARGGG